MHRQFRATIVLLSALFGACSAMGGSGGGGGGGTRDGGGGGGGGGETTHEQCGDGVDNDRDGLSDCGDPGCAVWLECGGSGDGGVGGGGTDGSAPCAISSAEAAPTFAPVDILWTIDNSGSMSEEASLVQEQLDDFTADILASGIDFRVVLITAAGFVTVDPSLASDAMRFRRVEQSVNSHDAFDVTVSSFGAYSDFLRPSARTHIVVVTDDESNSSETSFRASMESMLGHSFVFHAIASEDVSHCMSVPIIGSICEPGCQGPRGDAADIGASYYRLAMATGGTTFSICSVDWSPLWATLHDSVVVSAAVPCRFSVPDPPMGMSFDPTAVTVTFTSSSGSVSTYAHALDASRCTDAAGDSVRAWYYDDNDAPTQILLCPAACMEVESDRGAGARVDVAFTCEPQVVLI